GCASGTTVLAPAAVATDVGTADWPPLGLGAASPNFCALPGSIGCAVPGAPSDCALPAPDAAAVAPSAATVFESSAAAGVARPPGSAGAVGLADVAAAFGLGVAGFEVCADAPPCDPGGAGVPGEAGPAAAAPVALDPAAELAACVAGVVSGRP